MTSNATLNMRLMILVRRESYVWLCRRESPCVSFGWLLTYRTEDRIVFKDDEGHAPEVIPVADVECCGAV